MLKKLIIVFLALFVMAFGASAAGNLNLYGTTEDSLNISGTHNSNVTGTLKVENTGAANLTNVNLTATNLVFGSYSIPSSAISFSNNNFFVGNNSNVTGIIASIIVPSSQYAGTYLGTITANGSASDYDTINLNLTVTPSYSISVPSSVTFPSGSQNSTVTTTFSIANNGNLPINNIVISQNADSKYSIILNQTSISSLGINENKTIKIDGFIPLKESTTVHSIGTISIVSDEKNASSTLSLDVQGKLRISDLDVRVGNGGDTNLDDGDKIDADAAPEDELEFDLKISNDFTDDDDLNIENIVVTITIEDIDNGDDVEEESDEFDLDADSYTRKAVNLKVPLDVKEDTYDIVIEAEGEDENGVEHKVKWTIYMDVNKKSHEVRIHDASLNPATVECSRETILFVELINIGANDEDDAKLTIKNAQLGIDSEESDIEIEEGSEDNTHEKSLPVIVPANFSAGTYPIEIKAYYNNNILDDVKTLELAVKDCKKEETPAAPKENQTTVIISQPGINITGIPLASRIISSTETPLFQSLKSPLYIIVLILGNVIIIGGIIAIIAKVLLIRS